MVWERLSVYLVKEVEADSALPIDDIDWPVAGVKDERPAPPKRWHNIVEGALLLLLHIWWERNGRASLAGARQGSLH